MKRELALKVLNLTVHYNQVPALWDIDLEIEQGNFVGILGPNGAGKSTLIKAILDLVPKVSGSVWIEGKALEEERRHIAYVPQRGAVNWDFPITVLELVLMGCYPNRGPFARLTKSDYERAWHALERVGIKELAERQISQLSGGQQQRAFIARALLQEADLYFLDEPLTGVDHASEEIIIAILSDIAREKSVFMVHHDLNTVEKYFSWVVLLNVCMIASGKTEEAFTDQNIKKAYGKNFALFDDAVKISHNRASGKLC